MKTTLQLKPIHEQVIVITGATSGHGLCTARMAAAQGAKVMLAARDEDALKQVCAEITGEGGIADYVVTDVARAEDMQRLADATIARYGGFDSWVNNAGIGVYAELLDLELEDHRMVFETNYWGVVHGSTVAARHLRDRHGGGTLINVGSINSDLPGPILGSYNASKHAVKGFTDSLRIEMQMKREPVSVTLIQPSAIGTPFPQHARNTTGYQARLPRPIYAPQVVARAILHAMQHERRNVVVGGAGKVQIFGLHAFPQLFDKIAASMADKLVDKDRRTPEQRGNLEAPQGNDGSVEGRQKGRNFSASTMAGRYRLATLGAIATLAAAGAWALAGARSKA